MSYFSVINTVHTTLSLAAIVVGIPAVAGFFLAEPRRVWMKAFLSTAFLTTATGFLFPNLSLTPAVITGFLALLVFAAVAVGARGRHRSPGLRAVYVGGVVASLYLLVFVGIAQAFQKIGPLNALAPTGTETPFIAVQGAALVGFMLLGITAIRVQGSPRPATI